MTPQADPSIHGFNECLNQYARSYCDVNPPPVAGEPCECHGVPWEGWLQHEVLCMDAKFIKSMNREAETLRGLWARPNCRHCHGRGWLLFRSPDGGEVREQCTCVARSMARECKVWSP